MSRECSATSLGMPDMSKGLHAKMSVLVRRKSTSTTSYFGSWVELTLNTLPSGGSGVEGHVLGLLGSLEAACMLGRGVGALADQLLHVCDKQFVQHERLGVLDAFEVAVQCVLDRRAHGDDALWPRHLHLEVHVVRTAMNLA
jgi:hypothetical protein